MGFLYNKPLFYVFPYFVRLLIFLFKSKANSFNNFPVMIVSFFLKIAYI